MALFFKDSSDKKPTGDDAISAADQIFDEKYRQELQKIGREHLKEQIEQSATGLKDDIDAAMKQVSVDLKDYMTRQLDITIGGISKEIMDQMHERISEFNRITRESEEEVTQNLHKNSQEVQEKFQRLSGALQQVVASHEVMMLTAVQDNKTRLQDAENQQKQAIQTLAETAEQSKLQSERLNLALQQTISEQNGLLNEVYRENLARVAETKETQAKSLETLTKATAELEKQYQELSDMLNKTISDQKEMVANTINDNMARIVEHYLIAAFGDSTDVKAQLPSILASMEASKKDMVEDMKL